MTGTIPTSSRRASLGALTLGFVGLVAGGLLVNRASAVAICQKTSPTGKHTFKLREACRAEKGELEVQVGTRTQVFHASNDLQQAISGSDIALAIDGAATSFSFDTTSASADVVVSFTAGCHVLDSTGGGWVDIDILVDSAAVAPTDLPRNGFCFQTGANDEVEHTASYSVAVEDLAAGTHTVQVAASNVSLTPTAFLGDVSLVVTVHEN